MAHKRRVECQSAYVLHSRAYRNTSVIIELLTAQYGRIGLVARGVRKAKSRQQGLLQPFQHLSVSWLMATELGTLISVEADGVLSWLQGSALVSGLYVNELLMRLLHRDDPHPQVFACYQRLLLSLAAQQTLPDSTVVERALRLFEKNTLSELGYGLQLEYEAENGRKIEDALNYRYIPDWGPVRCHERGSSHGQSSSAGVVVAGRSLRALACDSLDDHDSLRDAKRLMRSLLHHCLGGRPLKSRELYRVYS